MLKLHPINFNLTKFASYASVNTDKFVAASFSDFSFSVLLLDLDWDEKHKPSLPGTDSFAYIFPAALFHSSVSIEFKI